MKKLSLILLALIALTQTAWAQVTYIERSWSGSNTGGSVVSTEKTSTSCANWDGTSNLIGGWYYFSGSLETNTSRIEVTGDTYLILADGCHLKHKRGIYIHDGVTLTIYGQSGDSGKLECPSADGDNAAIGGNKNAVGGTLVIHGGHIIAKADHNNAAGIGGGNGENSGMRGITIWGGTVEATGKDSGAGIGGGQQNNVYIPVTIYGGTVTASTSKYAAGIGGGEDRGNGTITIYGGNITATGGGDYKGGAGIGGGDDGSQNNPIYIYGGTITATGGDYSAGIGGGGNGNGGTVYIYGGTVNATSSSNGAGIGGGYYGNGGNIEISGGTVTATGKSGGAGIGGGDYGNAGTLTINGGTVTAEGGNTAAGIGGGNEGEGGTVTINGGTVSATSVYYGSGIGGGYKGKGANVYINGGTVTAKNTDGGWAIGGGKDCNDNGSVTLGNAICVRTGSTTGSLVTSSNRVSTLMSSGERTAMDCTHSGATFTDNGNAYHHHVDCQYCLATEDPHIKGEGNDCTKCHRLMDTDYDINNETDLRNALQIGANIRLTADIALSEKLEIASGKTVTIDLNGHTLDRGTPEIDWYGMVIHNYGNLTITDNSRNDSGKIKGGRSHNGGGILCEENSTLTVNGGTFTDNQAAYYSETYPHGRGGAIFMNPGSTLIVNGGKFENNSAYKGGAICNEGTATFNNGTITNCSAQDCGGIYNNEGCTLTISGGEIKNCSSNQGGGAVVNKGTATLADITIQNCEGYNGGAINNHEGASFTITNCTFTGNTASYCGGAIYNKGTLNFNSCSVSGSTAPYGGAIYNTGTYTMDGGTISNSQSTTGGGGGLVNIGMFNISGSTFSGNSAATNGGGLWNGNSGNAHGVLTISDGTISGNHANDNGGGIWTESTLNMKGKVIVNNNTGGNLYLLGNNVITVTDTFDNDTRIGVTTQTLNRVFTSGYSNYHGSTAPGTYFISDVSSATVALNSSNEVYLRITYITTEDELNNSIDTGINSLTLGNDIALQNYVGIGSGKNVTLDLNGHTLSRSLSESSDYGMVVWVRQGGTLTIQDGAGGGQIKGGNSTNGGGIANNGTVTLAGGTISSCQASNCGGGIYNGPEYSGANAATFTMTGGVITGCYAQDCGGIYNYQGSTVTISGGTISNCTSNQGGGGINNKGTMTISGGTISGNHASESGGGVRNGVEGLLTITGGTITGNRADTNGGGVWTASDITMSGKPYIKDNEGSNLYLNGSSTKINCGTFSTGASIGVILSDYDRVFTNGYGNNNPNTYANTYFSTDVEGAAFSLQDGEAHLSSQGGVFYVERSWTGSNTDGHVVKTTKLCTDYSDYDGRTDVNTGWYLLRGSHTYENRIACHGDVKFILQDGSETIFDNGIHIDNPKYLTIYGQSGDTGKIKVYGDGEDDNAAIGGNDEHMGGYLTIHGGYIWVRTGSNNVAAIGGGEGHNSGMQSITIWGGTINALAQSSGAGIGCGEKNDNPPDITIYGGNITAQGGKYGAGIGGSEDSANGTITIYGGTINATGGKYGAGIGSGQGKDANPITIYGGDITAQGGVDGAGIGGGRYDNGGTITIHGGNITVNGKDSSAAIGGGYQGTGGTITIYGGNISGTGGQYAAAIGGGKDGDAGTITIYDGTLNVTGGDSYTETSGGNWGDSRGGAGIGGGHNGNGGTITIYSGTINATSGVGAAAIGGGQFGAYGTIKIYGGNITATGQHYSAGIGCGSAFSSSLGGGVTGNGTITIYDGTVTATGGKESAGIGGGDQTSCGTVIIYGGTVTATGGVAAAGIGGGSEGDGGTVTISGGIVTAIGGEGTVEGQYGGAGIGGGYKGNNGGGSGGTVTISGGIVTVEGKDGGKGIGRGYNGDSDGDLTLGATLSVQPWQASISRDGDNPGLPCVISGERVTALREEGKYTIQECEHSNITGYTDKDDYYHHINCQFCEGEDEHHIKCEGDSCSMCGHHLPAYAYTLYEANEAGTGYAAEGTAYYVTATHKFTFPSCSVVPNKMTFAGWLLSNDTVPSSLIAGSTENLIQADSTITVPMEENRTYYARFKNTYFSGGSGSASDPFLISDTEDWDHLANAVNDGINFNGMYFVMTNDISTVTTMAGQGSNRFRGTFDGQGYTLTVSYTGITDDYCAPFRHISGATIKNLNTTGTIETSGRYAAGVVGYTRYYSKIENCHSDVTIRSSHAGWAGHGGILGLKANVTMSEPTIEGCVFNGKILSTGTTEETKTTGAAGIVGYTNYQTLTIKNCLYKPAALADGETAVTDGSATLYINASGAGATTVTCTECYYTEAYGSEQGTHGYTVTSGTSGLTLDFGSATKTYEYNGIEMYGFGLSYGGLFYSGGTTTVTFTLDLSEGYAATNVTASSGTLTDDGNYNFTLTMPSANVTITATMAPIASREVAAAEDWTTASKGWVFIASPVITSEDMEPEDVSGLVAENEDDYDLYRLNPSNTKWENWKEHEGNAAAGFCLENGRGYLYATKYAMTLIFAGTFNTKDKDTIPLSQGFNLVGNPFTVSATINKSYYTLNSDGSAVQTETSSEAIPPCHGVIVEAESANDSVVFTKVTQQTNAIPDNGSLRIALSQVVEPVETPVNKGVGPSTGSGALLDNAIITFNEGSRLRKFYFGTQNANIYIPQGNQDYAIAFSEGQGEMPLNFKATEDGEYTITVHPENVEMAYLHLIDNMTGADVDLLAGCGDARHCVSTYTFTAKTTDYESRFRLVFSVEDGPSTGSGAFAFISNGEIIITADACDASLQIVDMMGRVIVSREGDAINRVSTSGMTAGVYVLQLIDGDDIKVQKIVIE